uniref:Uncharacterized protein n=1 Tax=Rousettus aegyptiacus TaxID=9407 RepID=A0A7J8C295_ROUAE|nr:hypothetical protein HJG63_009269 [Rousettus aegyptiacus]
MHGWRGYTGRRPQRLRPEPRTRAVCVCVCVLGGWEREGKGKRGRGGKEWKESRESSGNVSASLRYRVNFLLSFRMFQSLAEPSSVCTGAPLKIILRTRSFAGVITHQLLPMTERTNSSKYPRFFNTAREGCILFTSTCSRLFGSWQLECLPIAHTSASGSGAAGKSGITKLTA